MKANKIMAAIGLTLAFGANAEGTNKVFNGYDVDPEAFDNVVHMYSDDANHTALCTGTIIGTKYVLTAGHCIEYTQLNQIKYKYFVTRDGVNVATQGIETDGTHVNVDYYYHVTREVGINDQAILRLTEVPDVTNFFEIKTAPTKQDRMFAIGFHNTDVLRSGTQPIVPHNKYPLYSDYSTLGQQVYHGDSGGPNVVLENSELKLVGTTSAGACSANLPTGKCVLGSVQDHYPTPTYHGKNLEEIAGYVNAFHFANSQITDNQGHVTMKVQSLYPKTQNITPSVNTVSQNGRPTPSANYTLSGTCTTNGALAMGEVCELVIDNTLNQAEYGEIDLGNGQIVKLNKPGEVKKVATINTNYLDIHGNQVSTLPTTPVPPGQIVLPSGGTGAPPSNSTPNTPSNGSNNDSGGGGSTGLLFGALLAAAALRKKLT